jgi:hypothetical protein
VVVLRCTPTRRAIRGCSSDRRRPPILSHPR